MAINGVSACLSFLIHNLVSLVYPCPGVFDLFFLSEGGEFDTNKLQMSNARRFAWPPQGGGNKL
jgi:hypothetical protein